MAALPYALKSGALSSHGRILRFVDGLPRESRILDIGTATGYLGAALRQRGFQSVSGIEHHAAWAAQARPFYQTVAVCDVEHADWPWPEHSFDVLICADILEHLREPARVLEQLSHLVVPGGWILISLPNMAHWSMRLSLLAGRFQYTASGLLDRSHLRFFTRATARCLLRQAGLAVHREAAIPLPVAHWCNGSRWTPLWRLLERIDWIMARLRPPLFAYQFVFVCQRRESPDPPLG